MIPTGFPQENTVLDAPKNVDNVECLSVCRTENENGLPIVISCWKLTAEELAEVNRTGRIWLVVLGTTMPPVSVEGESPFSP